MAKSPITVGIIGCGYWGPNYVRVFNEMFPSSVKWCCDLDPKRLERFRSLIPHISTNYHDILKDSAVDAVCISTPATSHFNIVKDALMAGKHVLVEKPITVNSDEALELKEIAQEYSKALLVGQIYRYHPAITKLKQLLAGGELGSIYYGHSARTGLGPIRYDVNAMWDLAPHDISEFIFLFSELPQSVAADGMSYLNSKEDVSFITLRFSNKKIVKIHTSWLDPVKVRRLALIGSKKMAVYDDTASGEMVKIYDRSVIPDETVASFGEFRLIIREGDVLSPHLGYTEPLKLLVKRFMELTFDPSKGIDELDDAISAVKVLEHAQHSLINGGKLVDINYSRHSR